MRIQYDETAGIFRLDTEKTSYIIGLADEKRFIGHVYYGKRISDTDVGYLMRTNESPFVPSQNNRDRSSFFDAFPMEYPGSNTGDFRESALEVLDAGGHEAVELSYRRHRIFAGKPALPGLPATFGVDTSDGEKECLTLEILAEDACIGLEATLRYSIFADVDAVVRSVSLRNVSQESIFLTKVMSASVDMDQEDYKMLTLQGSWARERHLDFRQIGYGKQSVGSVRGESSHQEHPFLALVSENATQEQGEVYGFHFVYSGNFLAQVEKTQFDSLRVQIGIHPKNFRWKLGPGECFDAPEAVLVYSSQGLGGMSRSLHDLYRNHLIRSPYKDKKRPILINNWEATYFDFDTEKLLDIARTAAKSGVEMLVLDDGWFGGRKDDHSSLGDWVVNEEKLPGSLKRLADEVNALGMKLGLWMEPEMVSPDSDLYRAHPDYALQIPSRDPILSRWQLVLDFSRKEVRDCVYDQLHKVLSSANIEYVKWDMNRELSDVWSSALPAGRQGELRHRYVLGVYELQERLLRDFPGLLLENCASGGSRFDPGMLYYSPQIWTSDNMDVVERLRIQEGTAMVYPLSTISAHVPACPSHTNGRTTPFETRGQVALPGCFGYELDLTKLTEEELSMIPGQLEDYKKYGPVFHDGDYYRLASYRENGEYDAFMSVTKDKGLAVVNYVQVLSRVPRKPPVLHLRGLDEGRRYRFTETGEERSGAAWMYGGLLLPRMMGDFHGKLFVLEEVRP